MKGIICLVFWFFFFSAAIKDFANYNSSLNNTHTHTVLFILMYMHFIHLVCITL